MNASMSDTVFYNTLSGETRCVVLLTHRYGVLVDDKGHGVICVSYLHDCGLRQYVHAIRDGEGDRYVAHNMEGPAIEVVLKDKVVYQFCVNGQVCIIEDMPIDPMLKMMWKLKYGGIEDGDMLCRYRVCIV
jgi:hypothetical protein